MSLITYEFNRADNAGEISQFRATLPILLEHYQGRNELVLYLSGKLNINGDNQEILIPRNLIKRDNEVTVRTGKNLFQHAYIDYDDIELTNIRIETRDKKMYAGGLNGF